MSDRRYAGTVGNTHMYVDVDDFRFGSDRLRNPAIVIPGRTKRWFHSWISRQDLTAAPPTLYGVSEYIERQLS